MELQKPQREADYTSKRGNLYWFQEKLTLSRVHGICQLISNDKGVLFEKVEDRNEELIEEIQTAYLSWKLM